MFVEVIVCNISDVFLRHSVEQCQISQLMFACVYQSCVCQSDDCVADQPTATKHVFVTFMVQLYSATLCHCICQMATVKTVVTISLSAINWLFHLHSNQQLPFGSHTICDNHSWSQCWRPAVWKQIIMPTFTMKNIFYCINVWNLVRCHKGERKNYDVHYNGSI